MADTRNQNEWSAVFLAAAELSRRGYCVALTLGPNAPLADLVVRSPQGKNFIVDVKGKGRSGRWCVKPKAPTPNLFYILVRLGPGPINKMTMAAGLCLRLCVSRSMDLSEFWLSEEQFERLRPLLPDKVRGVAGQ